MIDVGASGSGRNRHQFSFYCFTSILGFRNIYIGMAEILGPST